MLFDPGEIRGDGDTPSGGAPQPLAPAPHAAPAEAQGSDVTGKHFPTPLSVNRGILDSFPDDRFQTADELVNVVEAGVTPVA